MGHDHGARLRVPSSRVGERKPRGPLRRVEIFLILHAEGRQDGVTVVGNFVSKVIPDTKLERLIYDLFEQYFEEDTAAIKLFRKEKGV